MPRLTKDQIAHATMRLDEQRTRHVAQLIEALGPEPEVPGYDDDAKTAMIRSGVATLQPKMNAGSVGYHRALGSYFDYPPTPEMEAANRALTAWTAAADKIREDADKTYNAVLDELIMAPDGKAALERIASAFA